eukprot:512538-Prymnesium_polylepis.2
MTMYSSATPLRPLAQPSSHSGVPRCRSGSSAPPSRRTAPRPSSMCMWRRLEGEQRPLEKEVTTAHNTHRSGLARCSLAHTVHVHNSQCKRQTDTQQ